MVNFELLSKTLSWLLRHAAKDEGIKLNSEGFANLDSVLKHKSFSKWTVKDVQILIDKHDKVGRFTIITDAVTGKLQIRANNFHSIDVSFW